MTRLWDFYLDMNYIDLGKEKNYDRNEVRYRFLNQRSDLKVYTQQTKLQQSSSKMAVVKINVCTHTYKYLTER